jgi:hypothetical protein
LTALDLFVDRFIVTRRAGKRVNPGVIMEEVRRMYQHDHLDLYAVA